MSHLSGRRAVEGWENSIGPSVMTKFTNYTYNFNKFYCTVQVLKLKRIQNLFDLFKIMRNSNVSNDINKKGKIQKFVM